MLSGDNKYNVWGLHFYNKNRNAIEKDFDKDIDAILNDKNTVIENMLDKKLAAHIDIGKMINTLTDDRKE